MERINGGRGLEESGGVAKKERGWRWRKNGEEDRGRVGDGGEEDGG